MTEAELLAAVIAAPDDDEPRLVYADWLTERGDPRGEYIQMACRQRRYVYYSPEYRELYDRMQALEAEHRAAWRAPLEGLIWDLIHDRGFIGYVGVTGDQFLSGFGTILERAPVRSVGIKDLDDDRLRRIAASPHLAVLGHAQLWGEVTAVGLEALGSAPHLRRGIGLSLSMNAITVDGARALAAGSSADRIAAISVVKEGLDDDAIAAFATMRGLLSLVALSENLGPASARALARAPWLQEIMLSSPRLGEEDWLLLAGIPSLRRLFLIRSRVTPDGARAIVARLPPSLHTLDLSDSPIGDVGALAIAAAPQLANLRELHLRGTGMTAAGLAALVASPHLRSLELFCVDGAPDEPLLALDDRSLLPSLVMVRFEGKRDLTPLLARSKGLRPGCWEGSLFRVRG
jgi:uncharacterized protein (TIGR02996 family)